MGKFKRTGRSFRSKRTARWPASQEPITASDRALKFLHPRLFPPVVLIRPAMTSSTLGRASVTDDLVVRSPALESSTSNPQASDMDSPATAADSNDAPASHQQSDIKPQSQDTNPEKKISCSTCREAKVSVFRAHTAFLSNRLLTNLASVPITTGQVHHRSFRVEVSQMHQIRL